MASILIRDIPKETIERLKSMAKEHNRSLQQELKEIVENVAAYTTANISKKASAMRKKLSKKGIQFSDSAALLRDDRCR